MTEELTEKDYEVLDACCELLSIKIDELKAENDRLKEENYGLNQELLGYKKGVQASEIVELKQTLQEIKVLAKKTGCRAIIDLITKAEEE